MAAISASGVGNPARQAVGVDTYLTRLASAEPVPGGGSAAMIVAATGCALVGMVSRICDAPRLADRADELQASALAQSARDEDAFKVVMQSRGAERQAALAEAAATPLEGMRIALDVMHLAAECLTLGNVNLVSDAGCAAEFGQAALLGCAYNVRINHLYLKDVQLVSEQRSQLENYEREATSLIASLRKAVNESLTR